jgi:hypothetical protein
LYKFSDEQLLAEVARRKLDLHDKITDAVVRETYDFGKVQHFLLSLHPLWRRRLSFTLQLYMCSATSIDLLKSPLTYPKLYPSLPTLPPLKLTNGLQVLGHGASGEVLLAIHKVTQQQFACKVVRKDTKMNDAQVRIVDGFDITLQI